MSSRSDSPWKDAVPAFLWILLLGAALLFALAALSGYLPVMLRAAGLATG